MDYGMHCRDAGTRVIHAKIKTEIENCEMPITVTNLTLNVGPQGKPGDHARWSRKNLGALLWLVFMAPVAAAP